MENVPYEKTVEYTLIRINDDWNYYNLAFYPTSPEESISLFDEYNPSFYLSFVIYNVWDAYTNQGKHNIAYDRYKDLYQTCIVLLSERYAVETGDFESNLALANNGMLFKYRNSVEGMRGDIEFLYTQLAPYMKLGYYSFELNSRKCFTNSDGEKFYIGINWL